MDLSGLLWDTEEEGEEGLDSSESIRQGVPGEVNHSAPPSSEHRQCNVVFALTTYSSIMFTWEPDTFQCSSPKSVMAAATPPWIGLARPGKDA